jgi:hypothetical protein
MQPGPAQKITQAGHDSGVLAQWGPSVLARCHRFGLQEEISGDVTRQKEDKKVQSLCVHTAFADRYNL